MGTERPNYMPKEEAFNEPEDFFSKSPTEISRRYCEPSREIYTGSSELRNNPFKAIESVDWLGPSLTEIEDPVEGLVVAAAKLETAQRELHLVPKQKELFEGLKENIDGAIGFLGALESTLKSKVIRSVASGATVVTMALSAAGCGNVVKSYVEITPNISPVTETTPTDSFAATPSSVPTPEISSTETQTSPEIEVAPYPTSSENFVKKPSTSGPDAEKRITELGAGGDLSALKDWYKANGIANSSMLPVIYEEGGDVHWDLAAKGSNGNFLKFTITSGEEADQIVRAMGMVSYLYNQPTFKISELIKPAELNGTTQQMIWDRSGWSVVGAFRGETLIGWFNADKNMWVMEQNPQVEVTPTPEYEPIHSSLEIEGSVDGVPVKVTFAIGQDMYEREDLPLDKWIINPEAQEFLSPRTVEEVLAKEIMKAHYFAWQGDDFVNRKPVTFEEYIQRLKDGEDMSYEIAAVVQGSVLETTVEKVDPLKPVTFVLVNKVGGYSGGVSARDLGTFNYVENGSLRMENYVSIEYLKSSTGAVDFSTNDPRIADGYTFYFGSSLQSLSMDIEYQKPGLYRSKVAEYSSKFFKERPEVNQLVTNLWLNVTGGTGEEAYTTLLLIKQK